MLTLKIENIDRLPDGGPIQVNVDQRGLDLGRDQYLDWTLPDPSRFISGKHCEVRFYEGCYWLFDVSTNGTFVNGSSKRMQSPYKLADGDRLTIGDYIIAVSVKGQDKPAAPPPVMRPAEPPPVMRPPEPPPPMPSADPWQTDDGPPAIDPRDLMPQRDRGQRAGDFLNSIPAIPPVNEPAKFAMPQPARQSFSWDTSQVGHQDVPEISPAKAQPAAEYWPTENEMPFPAPPKELPPTAPVVQETVPQAGAPPPAAPSPGAGSFIEQFAAGARIPMEHLHGRDAGTLGRELGALLNLTCANLMQLLQARAAAKTLARSGHRTLIQPAENNPLKFMPTAEDAIKVMLGPGSGGYLDSRKSIERSFSDIKSHQVATLAAMQLAVAQLVEDLAPEAIEKAGGTSKPSLLGGGKARHWDTFVERWKAKTARHEHGMLGEFLELYAKFYDQQSRGNQ